jgi:hypothetical protein
MEPIHPNVEPKTEACARLLEIWKAARGEKLMPRRSGIDPAKLRAIMPQIAVVAVSSPGTMDIRLAGTAYRDIFGFEPTSKNLIVLTPADMRRQRAYRFYMGVTQPCAGRAVLSFDYSHGASDRFEFLALPLEAASLELPRLMICAIESIMGRRWRNEASEEVIAGPAESFDFIDIGAGLPASDQPPADFAING